MSQLGMQYNRYHWDAFNQAIRLCDMQKFQHFLNVERPAHSDVTDQDIFERLVFDMLTNQRTSGRDFQFAKKALIQLSKNPSLDKGKLDCSRFTALLSLLVFRKISDGKFAYFKELLPLVSEETSKRIEEDIDLSIQSEPLILVLRTIHHNFPEFDFNASTAGGVTPLMMINLNSWLNMDALRAAEHVGMDFNAVSEFGGVIEFSNINLSADVERIKFLIEKGLNPCINRDFISMPYHSYNGSELQFHSFDDYLNSLLSSETSMPSSYKEKVREILDICHKYALAKDAFQHVATDVSERKRIAI